MYTADRSVVENLTFEIVVKFIKRHTEDKQRFNKLYDYYRGKHDILMRKKEDDAPNNKIVCNHAKEISDTATGYFIGNPISYTGEGLEKIKEWFKTNNIDKVDLAIAKNMSIFGKGFEMVCMSDDEAPIPESFSLKPQNAFIVYDDTVKHRPLFGVYYYLTHDIDGNHTGYKILVRTAEEDVLYKADTRLSSFTVEESRGNPFGMVPIIEYHNNDEDQGDFEQVIGLIDAYNLLMSDRVNDKEQFVDAILVIINAMLGDTPEEASEEKQKLQKSKLLELPGEADARYLTRTFDERGISILQKELEQDIHKFANIPCLSDENFVGNASGVAMEYKMLGLETITKIKERMFDTGAQKRIELYGRINKIKGGGATGEAELTFTRGLPKDLKELSAVVAELEDIVPLEILLPLLPFIKDPKEAIKLLKKQKAEQTQEKQKRFGIVNNTPPGDDEE